MKVVDVTEGTVTEGTFCLLFTGRQKPLIVTLPNPLGKQVFETCASKAVAHPPFNIPFLLKQHHFQLISLILLRNV